MVTKVTLNVDDQTSAGFNSAAQGAQKSAGKMKKSFDDVARGQTNVTLRGSQMTRGLLEASRGIEDFAVQLGPQGLAGGLRAASNNMSQMAFVMGGPLAGAIAGVGVALGTILIPKLFETEKAAKSVEDAFTGLFTVESTRISVIGKTGEAQRKNLDTLIEQRNEHQRATKALQNEQASVETLVKTREENAKLIHFAITTSNKKLEIQARAEQSLLEKRMRGESMIIDAILEERTTIEDAQRHFDELLKKRVVREIEINTAIKERRELLKRIGVEAPVPKGQPRPQGGGVLREGLERFDHRVARELEKSQTKQLERIKDIDDELKNVRQKQGDIRRILDDAAWKDNISRKDAQAGLRVINDLRDQENALLGRRNFLLEEGAQLQLRYMEEARKKFEEQMKQVAGLPGVQAGVQQIQGLAQHIAPGQIFRRTAQRRIEERGGDLTREALLAETRKVRGEAVAGKIDPKELRAAQTQLVEELIKRAREVSGFQTGKVIKEQQLAGTKEEVAAIQRGELSSQQLQQAQTGLIKSSISLAGQQGKLGQSVVNGLTQAADTMQEQAEETSQIADRIQKVESFMKSIQEGIRRRQSQRRGTRG